MREQGVVRKVISRETVEISVEKSASCHQCKACRDTEGEVAFIEAVNAAGAKEGDLVEIDISTRGVVVVSSVVYLLPIAFLMAGYLSGSLLTRFFYNSHSEGLSVLSALIFLAASFMAVRYYDRRMQRRGGLRARVLRVTTGPESEKV